MTLQHVDTPNANLAYGTFGDANNPAIVMIHGLGTQMIGWQDAFLQSIADEGYFVVRFDNRDIGLSTHLSDAGTPGLAQFMAKEPVTESAYRLADMADDVAGKRQRRRSPARLVVYPGMGHDLPKALWPEIVHEITSVAQPARDAV